MAESENSQWVELYKAALLEVNPRKLGQRVELAEIAVRERQKMLLNGSRHEAADLQSERQYLADALRNLSVLKLESAKATNPTQ